MIQNPEPSGLMEAVTQARSDGERVGLVLKKIELLAN